MYRSARDNFILKLLLLSTSLWHTQSVGEKKSNKGQEQTKSIPSNFFFFFNFYFYHKYLAFFREKVSVTVKNSPLQLMSSSYYILGADTSERLHAAQVKMLVLRLFETVVFPSILREQQYSFCGQQHQIFKPILQLLMHNKIFYYFLFFFHQKDQIKYNLLLQGFLIKCNYIINDTILSHDSPITIDEHFFRDLQLFIVEHRTDF